MAPLTVAQKITMTRVMEIMAMRMNFFRSSLIIDGLQGVAQAPVGADGHPGADGFQLLPQVGNVAQMTLISASLSQPQMRSRIRSAENTTLGDRRNSSMT